MAAEDRAKKFAKEYEVVSKEILDSKDFENESEAFLKGFQTGMTACKLKCGNEKNCMNQCITDYFKGFQRQMVELDQEMIACEKKCESKTNDARVSCYRTECWTPLVRIQSMMNLNIIARMHKDSKGMGRDPFA